MKWKILGLCAVILVILWSFVPKASEPTMTINAEILALEDVAGADGLRRIQVKLPDGEVVWIETLAPFFYRVGYTAKLAVYEPVFSDPYFKVIAD